MAVITVVGAGMMGSALCVPLTDRGHEVRLVGTPLDAEIIASLQQTGIHPKLGVELPRQIRSLSYERIGDALAGADYVALGVSSAGIPWAASAIGPHLGRGVPIFMITKGLAWERGELRVLPDVFRDLLPMSVGRDTHPMAVGGPCIAGELARRVPSCVVLTGRDAGALDVLGAELGTDYYHVLSSTDLIGVEVGAALKNAYAMGVAFGAGLHERAGGEPGSIAMHNLESAVFAQAVREMRRIARHLGARVDDAFDLAGIGDLDVTNNGGRTGRFGRLLGRGLSTAEAISAMQGATLECLEILSSLRPAMTHFSERGELSWSDLPLLEHMIHVALDGAPVDLPLSRFFGRGSA